MNGLSTKATSHGCKIYNCFVNLYEISQGLYLVIFADCLSNKGMIVKDLFKRMNLCNNFIVSFNAI